MSFTSSSRNLNISKNDGDSSFCQVNSKKLICHRFDVTDRDKDIPDMFITNKFIQSDNISNLSYVSEKEKNILNIFNTNKFQTDSTHTSSYNDKFFDYPNLFTLQHETFSKSHSFQGDCWDKYRNYTNVFSLSDNQNFFYEQHLEINNSDSAKHEKSNLISNGQTTRESSFKEILSDTTLLEENNSNTTERISSFECEPEDVMSSALCWWYIVTGMNVRDNNTKTYFPQKEISRKWFMKDIKLMLINMGTTYFLVDEETQKYEQNRNISIAGLTPEMFESAVVSILECSNLYKTLRNTISSWKKICDDSLTKAFIFSVQNILDDYERTIYAIPDESLLSLVDRLSYITPCLQMLLNVCCSFTYDSSCIPDFIPCGMTLLNKIYEYLCDYRFSRDSFLKMLVYIFQSCCLAYFRVLSNWALKGVLNDKEPSMFIQLKPDIEDKEISQQREWNTFIIDETIKAPMFIDKFKKTILLCGKTVHFFNKLDNLNIFSHDITCCFDAVDTQKVYESYSVFFKYDPVSKTKNCHLYKSLTKCDEQKEDSQTDMNNTGNENISQCLTEDTKAYLNNENYEFFQIPDWDVVDNEYDFNKPYKFFGNHNSPLMYNGKPFDVVNMLDYIPHSLLIPAQIQKNFCDKQILDMFFVQQNLMKHLYLLSQCFFLVNSQFSFKFCETLFNTIAANRRNPLHVFNSVKLKAIVDEALHGSILGNESVNLTLDITFMPNLNGIIDISDVECIELNYAPEWPMNMILSDKILLKYRRVFLFANKLEYVSWCLSKAREILSTFKNDTGEQIRKINLFKHSMNQFVSSIQQYYKQVVISSCWSELNENIANVKNYDELFAYHKQYMHKMLSWCLMIVGLKDKLVLLNKIYIQILAYYQALASGQFYTVNSEQLHSEFLSMEQAFTQFSILRAIFYTNMQKTVQTKNKHYVVHLESLITILGPS